MGIVANPTIIQRYTDNILIGSTVTATTAPLTSYSLSTLLTMNPAARVRFGVKSNTLNFALLSSSAGAILVIPMHNLDAGSSVLSITNSAGLNQAITIPAYRVDGFPPTLMVDLSSLSNLTAGTWHLVITSNTADIQLGGAIAIYGPKRTLSSITPTGTVVWQYAEDEMRNEDEIVNEYGTPYIQDYETYSGYIESTAVGRPSAIQGLLDMYRANYGRVRNGVWWPDPSDASGGYFGRWQKEYQSTSLTSKYRSVKFRFDLAPKGKPM